MAPGKEDHDGSYVEAREKNALYPSFVRKINNLFEDEYFYDYQFQKSLDDPRGLKLIGIRNVSIGDHKNNGTWAIVSYPYRTGPGEDFIVSFDRQLMGIPQQGLLGRLQYRLMQLWQLQGFPTPVSGPRRAGPSHQQHPESPPTVDPFARGTP